MSYNPTNWKAGDTVTSAKLNKIEQGIAASGRILIAHEDENSTLDKTWQEIYDADVCYIIGRSEDGSDCRLVIETEINNDLYIVRVFNFMNPPQTYATDSPSNYPIPYINSNDSGNMPTPAA